MLFVFFVLLLATTVHSAPAKDTSITSTCSPDIDYYSDCTASVESVSGCTEATINFTNTLSAQCNGINFLWMHPANNLTMILESPFTKLHQAYKIIFNNIFLMEDISNVYQIINNIEIEVTTHATTLTLNSDSNYQVIVKFVASAQPKVSGISVRYEAVKS